LPEKLPLLSSKQIDKALRRLGFQPGPKNRGSHQCYSRRREDGHHDTTTIVLGAKEVPRGTLDNILTLGNIDREDFQKALR
jgi:predicted RNA binding protein YcfA (HicA-like mRNA interferase family)